MLAKCIVYVCHGCLHFGQSVIGLSTCLQVLSQRLCVHRSQSDKHFSTLPAGQKENQLLLPTQAIASVQHEQSDWKLAKQFSEMIQCEIKNAWTKLMISICFLQSHLAEESKKRPQEKKRGGETKVSQKSIPESKGGIMKYPDIMGILGNKCGKNDFGVQRDRQKWGTKMLGYSPLIKQL